MSGLPDRLRSALPGLLVAFMVAAAVARIVATYPVLNQVYDEPAHLASGIEYLQTGGYRFTPDHTPLPRVLIGLLPYLSGSRLAGREDPFVEGTAILNAGAYDRTLALARVGILPFFVLASFLVWLWTRRVFGSTAGLVATLLFTSLPPVLAHGGLATTDMAFTAGLFAAVYGFARWMERPAWPEAVFLGVGLALAVTTKYSALLFLPICLLLVFMLARGGGEGRTRPWLPSAVTLSIALLVAFVGVWAAYRFSFGPVQGLPFSFSVPAPQWLRGLVLTRGHVQTGHPSYLLGQVSLGGWWYFFPVVLAVKTPLAFLALVFAGLVTLARASRVRVIWQRWAPFYCATGLLLACLLSTINLGVRHILPIYPFLAVVAGAAVAALLESRNRWAMAAAVGLLCWHLYSSAVAHPDYLSYFNELASRHPERVLAESDLDWGQDVKRLSAVAREMKIPALWISYFGTADLNRFGLPPWQPLEPYRPVAGWVAISVNRLEMASVVAQWRTHRPEGGYDWLRTRQPVAHAGKSIWIYYIPPQP
jgi:4-amino-4-deoxy-L-arabinose transferase-like glycosyltransferase